MRYAFGLVALLMASTAWAQVDDPATPNKNEAVLTVPELSPVVFTRSAALETALLQASALVTPLDATGAPSASGKILTVGGGMSNSRNYWQDLYGMLTTTTYKTVRNPASKLLRQGDAGSTAKEWANCGHNVWSYAVLQANNAGGAAAVQWGHFYMTEMSPLTYGTMSPAQLDGIVSCQRQWFPNTRGVTFSTIQWTGQSLIENYAPGWSVAHDDGVLAAYAGVHLGIPVDYVQVYANGNEVNPANGLTWLTADSVTDGIHPTPAGSLKMATYYGAQLRSLPWYWFYWNDRTAPNVEPPPPPSPVTVPLSGATVTKDGATCTVQGTEPNGVTYTAAVPAIWCAGL